MDKCANGAVNSRSRVAHEFDGHVARALIKNGSNGGKSSENPEFVNDVLIEKLRTGMQRSKMMVLNNEY